MTVHAPQRHTRQNRSCYDRGPILDNLKFREVLEFFDLNFDIFNGVKIPFKFGVLPDDLEVAMLSGRTSAIIGADIFYRFTLTFNYNQKRIYIKNF